MARESGKRSQAAVLVEEMRTELSKVAEGHDSLARAIYEMRSDFGSRLEFLEKSTMEGFGKVWQAVDQNTQKISEMSGQLERLVQRFDSHERVHRT